MTALNTAQVKEMLLAVSDAIVAAKPMLTEIDSKIGDGDHGIGMELGMQKAREALEKIEAPATVGELFKACGRAMMMSMGGASGVIFGTMFQGGVKAIGDAAELNADVLRQLFRASLDAVKKRGGAQVGDKTMVDALEPAVEAMEACAGEDVQELVAAAVAAAEQGVENTKNQVAKFGRAKSLMERSIGYQDAGATSVWLILKAMQDYMNR